MGDHELLQAIYQDMQGMKSDMQDMKSDMQDMKSDMQGMKSDIQNMKTDIQNMKTDIQDMKADIRELEQRVNNIELKLENVTNHNIQLLAENHMNLVDKLNQAIRVSDKTLLYEVQVSTLKSKLERLEKEIEEIKARIA